MTFCVRLIFCGMDSFARSILLWPYVFWGLPAGNRHRRHSGHHRTAQARHNASVTHRYWFKAMRDVGPATHSSKPFLPFFAKTRKNRLNLTPYRPDPATDYLDLGRNHAALTSDQDDLWRDHADLDSDQRDLAKD